MKAKGCFDNQEAQYEDGECKIATENGVTGNICVCHNNLCNHNSGERSIPKGYILLIICSCLSTCFATKYDTL